MSPYRLADKQAQPVIRRLNAIRKLSEAGVAGLEKAILDRIHRTGPGEDLICEGERPDSIRMILSGWLCRYKTLADGRRQIVNFVLPGDCCDPHIYLMPEMDHSIGTLTPVVYSEIEVSKFRDLVGSDRTAAEALWCETLISGAIAREWIINVGRRTALERVAHLLCEIFERLRVVGMVEGTTCAFPINQMDMADATGLSVVHLNRTLQVLRGSGLVILRDRTLTINDLDALKDTALFSPNYLHLNFAADEGVNL
jgi:CRP-like cAMP-binding protein